MHGETNTKAVAIPKQEMDDKHSGQTLAKGWRGQKNRARGAFDWAFDWQAGSEFNFFKKKFVLISSHHHLLAARSTQL